MTWWQYLILANVYLILFYGFYALLLRRETFFQLNRVYLVSTAILSFLLPLVQADWARNLFITQQLKQTIYHLDPVVIYQLPAAPSQHLTVGQILAIIYVGGIILLASRFMLQLMVLRYNIKYNDSDDAYSFFKTIKLGETLGNRGVIMAHEEVHAKQWHSADVMLIEAVMIINWFNPAVYFYRKAIKHVHEFIADRNAVKTGTSKQEYALLLLSETFKTPAHQLVNPFFNHSLLKQRILMLQKNNSQRTALLKYGLSAPLFALMLILSSATVNTNRVITLINDKAEEVMMVPAAAPALQRVFTTVTSAKVGDKITTTVTSAPNVQEFKPSAQHEELIIDKPDTTKESELFTAVENQPTFKGGTPALAAYLSKNINYPDELRKNNLQARIIVGFIVEPDGAISHVRALNGHNSAAAAEAVRVVAASPKWNPGVQNGKKVRVEYNIPIDFKLNDNKDQFRITVIADTLTKRTANNKMLYYQYSYNNKPAALAGVSSISTYSNKKADSGRLTSTVVYRTSQSPPLLLPDNGSLPQPIYYLDGKEIKPTEMKDVAPGDIESVTVLKDGSATQLYGDKAKNGVILIITKKPK